MTLLPITAGMKHTGNSANLDWSTTKCLILQNREDYYYSLILLFVPFRDEGALLRENETAEEAFNCLLPNSDDCSNYHKKLQTMLNAEAKVRKIDEARKAEISKNKYLERLCPL